MASARPTATSNAHGELRLPAFELKSVRDTGLKSQSEWRKRNISLQTQRDHPGWACVEILDETTDVHQPTFRCLGCDSRMKGGAHRVASHLLGLGASKKCDMSKATPEFEAKLQKVIEYVEVFENKKARKQAVAKVNASTGHSAVFTPMVAVGSKQGRIQLDPTTSSEVDSAIAEFFFGCNISANIAEHVLFKKMVHILKSAPASYKSPTRKRLYGKLLDDTTDRIRDDI